jgi:hypothetical protein
MDTFIRRTIWSVDEEGQRTKFDFSISQPFEKPDGMFACEINLQPRVIVERTTIHGIDPVDAMEMAIELLDTLIFEGDHGLNFQWEDGSNYSKSKTALKYVWNE